MCFLQEKTLALTSLEEKLAALQGDYDSLQTKYSETSELYKVNEQELQEKTRSLENTKEKLTQVENLMLSKDSEIADGITRLHDLEAIRTEKEASDQSKIFFISLFSILIMIKS